MPGHTGFSHVSLSVTDLAESVRWYTEVLDFAELTAMEGHGYEERICVHPSGFALGLQQHEANDGATFDPARTGLDHLSFAVADRAELDSWTARLAAHGVKHSPIAETPFGAVLCFRDPDDIQLELFCMA
ncbi:VOC family protein [Yinghuangia seranimata]|uniref:VOC family protein n=1 Tax=Yinghuangia seranimata TaxID=408067 RepID=UPI00248CB8F7|nr:VOC family protein [Yinghuangia seranimata]MDI2128895.1 VOC family protein [Yinghuangia seranimata]